MSDNDTLTSQLNDSPTPPLSSTTPEDAAALFLEKTTALKEFVALAVRTSAEIAEWRRARRILDRVPEVPDNGRDSFGRSVEGMLYGLRLGAAGNLETLNSNFDQFEELNEDGELHTYSPFGNCYFGVLHFAIMTLAATTEAARDALKKVDPQAVALDAFSDAVDWLEETLERVSHHFDPPAEEASSDNPDLVTLLQIGSVVSLSKKTMERYKKERGMPEPKIVGGRGRAARWEWSEVRPWLIETFGARKTLPERFPDIRRF